MSFSRNRFGVIFAIGASFSNGYDVQVRCENCGASGDLYVKRGQQVPTVKPPCPTCECRTLKRGGAW